MYSPCPSPRRRSFAPAAIALVLGTAIASAAAAEPRPLRVRVQGAAGMAVQRAWQGARLRLAHPACRQVLSDFSVSSYRRTLAEVPDLLGRSLEEHMDDLTFTDGARKGRCASSVVLAFTRPGDNLIRVCPSQFLAATRNDPGYAEIILIHELLHTLGLGEDPPTSLEITARVSERCRHVARQVAEGPR
ncbi:MAG TPA: hypothetical protein VI589_04720 [Vicinamibacteria bacterium]